MNKPKTVSVTDRDGWNMTLEQFPHSTQSERAWRQDRARRAGHHAEGDFQSAWRDPPDAQKVGRGAGGRPPVERRRFPPSRRDAINAERGVWLLLAAASGAVFWFGLGRWLGWW